MKNKPIIIEYFSDVLCVWAWIAQNRIDELGKQFAGKIEIRNQYLDLFADTATHIQDQWAEKGHYAGFGDYVVKSAAPYVTAPVNNDIWHKVRPSTSANAHLVLKAIQLTHNANTATEFALALRKAFFIEARDISHMETIKQLLVQDGIDIKTVDDSINNGTALAALMCDFHKAKQFEIKGSPTLILDNGRQTLYGNVCYRVMHTNVEELLNNLALEGTQ